MTFDSLRIDTRCLAHLREKGITAPTPIQAQAIPVALTGRDLTAIAQTGTGKTLAFGLPALTQIAALPKGYTRMVLLAPTRELVQQVHDVLAPLARVLGLSTACVYGGVGMEPQAQALRRGTSIILACPGRLLDHVGRGNHRFDHVTTLVLDEADRMLDMGFLPDIRRVVATLPTKRQTMMFSATFPKDIAKLAESMMTNPARVEVGTVARPAESVRQSVVNVNHDGKMSLLRDILAREEVGSTIVFVRTKRGADRVTKALERQEITAVSVHGGHTQGRRNSGIAGFRSGRHRVLVATDVAARGLDVKGVSHVINYDMPSTTDDYIHRIGRTARAEATGDAITFVTGEDHGALRDIEKHIGRKLDRTRWEGGPTAEDVADRRAERAELAAAAAAPPASRRQSARPARPSANHTPAPAGHPRRRRPAPSRAGSRG
ncbi:DEAD/DEAH box helicase [bacterium]|nr:DEAD/DEAH box helicase [bacterium]